MRFIFLFFVSPIFLFGGPRELIDQAEFALSDEEYQTCLDFLSEASTSINEELLEQDEKTELLFRLYFSQSIAYCNSGDILESESSLEKLTRVADLIGCAPCKDTMPCMGTMAHKTPSITLCSSKDSYEDIIGPNKEPNLGWCNEVVIGTTRALEGIALLAKSNTIRIGLISIIEALKTRALHCCETGDFWKACVAPLARKWKEWNGLKNSGIFPTIDNYNRYLICPDYKEKK